MNETPRLKSAFPQTPRSGPRFRNVHNNAGPGSGSPRPSTPPQRPSPITRPAKPAPAATLRTEPVIPLAYLDGPSQRWYLFAFYVTLGAWRLYDSSNVQGDLDTTWLFLKWIGIDAAFFTMLPVLNIPWMQFSFLTTFVLWLLHAVANLFLMYKIPIPIMAALGSLVKVVYDKELSISDTRVKPAEILRNASIISGKQIIQILPEGSAILNPDKQHFCLDASIPSVELPIRINQTTPITIELLRFDLDTDEVETIVINKKQAGQLKKQADKGHSKSDTKTPRTLQYSVSKKGLYRLQRVIDATNLDVRRASYDVAVVPCPQASLLTGSTDRCTGDLSDVSLHVSGVPPFKVKYSKSLNRQQSSSIVQHVQPQEGDDTEETDEGVVLDPKRPQMGWTQSKTASIDINESLHSNGSILYTVEAVEDGLGNKVVYDEHNPKHAHAPRTQGLIVHNRPQISLADLNADRLIPLPKDASIKLPARLRPRGQLHSSDWPLRMKYTFVPEAEQDASALQTHEHTMTDEWSVPRIGQAGKYSIESIDSQYCHGEVVEPSSCLLYNPPQPDLTIESEDIFDKCAGNPIGMYVNLDFTGTPPFKVRYTIEHKGHAQPKVQEFSGMRGQIEFREQSAGSYTYQIREIEDKVYGKISLNSKNLVLKQDINPPASAQFQAGRQSQKYCLGEQPSLQVRLLGQGPWDLDYELIHGGKRKKHTVHSEEELVDIMLPQLTDGGKYTVMLTGVQDKTKCRKSLKEEREFEVRPEQPSAAFGDIDGKRSILALDGKSVRLPLRLKGQAPWSVRLHNVDDGSDLPVQILRDANSYVSVDRPGTYEIIVVEDSCPGTIDPKTSQFRVDLIARPSLDIKDSSTTVRDSHGIFRKDPVCQGDESNLALGFTGTPPYHLKYQQKFEPVRGPSAIANKPGTFANKDAIITLDTSRAGEYTYVFTELADSRYAHDRERFSPLQIRQQVFAPPTAKFTNPGKTYSYCKDDPTFSPSSDSEAENIPITFTGTPPFSVEIAITHHGVAAAPEVVRKTDIPSTSFNYPLYRSSLDLGTHTLSIRSVKDAKGCETLLTSDPSSIRISVSSPPTIIPLESQTDYCVGDYVSFSLSGQPPFEVYYTFQGKNRVARVDGNEFRRIAESPGEFAITAVSDAAMGKGKCRARKDIVKAIHPFPTVKLDRGLAVISDIHEGGEVDMTFDFTGTPPFEFTYTRSENLTPAQRRQRKNPTILETRHDTCTAFSKTVRASDAGTYEVVAIKDRYCAYTDSNFARAGGGGGGGKGKAGPGRLTY